MSTSSPVRKVHDIPIENPQPARLPAASPGWIVPAPSVQPARVPEPVRRK